MHPRGHQQMQQVPSGLARLSAVAALAAQADRDDQDASSSTSSMDPAMQPHRMPQEYPPYGFPPGGARSHGHPNMPMHYGGHPPPGHGGVPGAPGHGYPGAPPMMNMHGHGHGVPQGAPPMPAPKGHASAGPGTNPAPNGSHPMPHGHGHEGAPPGPYGGPHGGYGAPPMHMAGPHGHGPPPHGHTAHAHGPPPNGHGHPHTRHAGHPAPHGHLPPGSHSMNQSTMDMTAAVAAAAAASVMHHRTPEAMPNPGRSVSHGAPAVPGPHAMGPGGAPAAPPMGNAGPGAALGARPVAQADVEMLKNMEKRAQKRAANRRSAQLSRRRKKAFIEELKKQNFALRKHEYMLEQISDAVLVFSIMPTWRVRYGNGSLSRALQRAGHAPADADAMCDGSALGNGRFADIMGDVLEEESALMLRDIVVATLHLPTTARAKEEMNKGNLLAESEELAEVASSRGVDESDAIAFSEQSHRKTIAQLRKLRVPLEQRLLVRFKTQGADGKPAPGTSSHANEESIRKNIVGELDGTLNLAAEPPEVVCTVRFLAEGGNHDAERASASGALPAEVGGAAGGRFFEAPPAEAASEASPAFKRRKVDHTADAGYAGDHDNEGQDDASSRTDSSRGASSDGRTASAKGPKATGSTSSESSETNDSGSENQNPMPM